MFSLQIILSALSISAVCFAGCLLHALRVTRQRVMDLEASAIDAETRIQSLEAQALTTAATSRSATAQFDALLIRLARIEKGSSKRDFGEAIDMSRSGADEKELEDTCGLSLGEARLIRTLYGTTGNTP